MTQAKTICAIHLPTHYPSGNHGRRVHVELERALCNAFGGLTTWEARGVWKAPDGRIDDESVIVYRVAVDRKDVENGYFRHVAERAARDLKQEALYVEIDGAAYVIGLTDWRP